MSMTTDEIFVAIKQLAQSQGFYSRLYENLCWSLEHDPERFVNTMVELEEMNLEDKVDLVLALET